MAIVPVTVNVYGLRVKLQMSKNHAFEAHLSLLFFFPIMLWLGITYYEVKSVFYSFY
jgi:hypothetical protein